MCIILPSCTSIFSVYRTVQTMQQDMDLGAVTKICKTKCQVEGYYGISGQGIEQLGSPRGYFFICLL